MKISFLIWHAYGMGGTIRTTITLANHLVTTGHEVEIISVVRGRSRPYFPIDPRIRLRVLVEDRGPLSRLPSWIVPRGEKVREKATLHHDHRLRRALRDLDGDVLIATRPALNIAAARFAPGHVVKVGQEHVFSGSHRETVEREMRRIYPRLDAFVTLTDDDRRVYQERVPGLAVHTIPNAAPARPRRRSPLTDPVILAVGRLAPGKRYDLLLRAFAMVAAVRPEWRLRIVGSGGQARRLRRIRDQLGLTEHVELPGATRNVEAELARASIHAVSSRYEGFGMTIVEAFACGVPVVSVDCPYGPRSLITHGHDGLLVSEHGLAAGLLKLVDDPALRFQMGDNAVQTAARYDIKVIADRWERLLRTLTGRPVPAAGRRTAGHPPGTGPPADRVRG